MLYEVITLDNDNRPSNEFDFDMSLYFFGDGFSYSNQVHHFKNMKGLPAADSLFFDNRWRHRITSYNVCYTKLLRC